MKRTPLIVAVLLLIPLLGRPAMAFDLLDMFPTFESNQVHTTLPLTVVFEEGVSTETVNDNSFYVTPLGEPVHVEGSIALSQTNTEDDTVVFTPSAGWQWGRRYQLTMTADVQSSGGEPFDGTLPYEGIFVANIPNDFFLPNYDPLNPPPFRDLYNQASALIGYNPFAPEEEAEPWEIPGMNGTGAFKYSTGSPNVIIAIVDTGILDYGYSDFRKNIFINAGELPLPNVNGEPCQEYDCNEDSRFDVDDYYYDDRLGAPGNRDAMDLIEAFSDGIDDDGNGLPDDISGWDFLRETNVALATTGLPLGEHGYWQVMFAANRGDNGIGGSVGTCPNCQVLPIRASTGILYDFGYLSAAFRYAATMGASVVSHAGANLTWSEQGHQAIIDGYQEGTVFVGVSNDEMTFHHWMPYAGEDALAVKSIFPLPPVDLFPYFATEDIAFTETWCTGYGSHVMLSIPTGSECTSEAGATIGGAFGLLFSYAFELGIDLEADEAKQIMTMSAYDIQDRCFNIVNLSHDCQEGFDDRYGYGRVDLGRALQMLGDPDFGIDPAIPPVVHVTSPTWWRTFDPQLTPTLDVQGSIRARQYPLYWSVQIAKGREPLEEEFIEADAGQTSTPIEGFIASIPLQNYFKEEWAARPVTSPWSADVTLRVQAYYETAKGDVILGESRKTIGVRSDNDPDHGLVPGFPIEIGASGESSPLLYDLDGDLDGRLEILFGTGAGEIVVLKYSEASGTWENMPGFPLDVSGDHPWYRACIYASLAVGDLFGDSTPEIVAATTDGKVYALDPMAAAGGDPMLPGFPVSADPVDPSTVISFAQGNGFMSSPVLADLDLDGILEIIAGSLDQKVYVWKPAKAPGTAERLPGWPVFCRSEEGLVDEDKVCRGNIYPNVVLGTPAVGILDPDHPDPSISEFPTVLVPTNEDCDSDEFIGTSRLYAVYHDGENHEGGPFQPGWPAAPKNLLNNMPFFNNIGGMAGSPAVFVGEKETRIAVGTTMWFPQLIHYKDGYYTVEEYIGSIAINAAAPPTISILEEGQSPTLLIPSAGALQWMGDRLKIYHTMVRGYNLDNIKEQVFEADFDDIPMLLNSVTADLDADGVREVISGTGDNLVHAHKADNSEVEGWPKATQKWTWASPAVGDMDGDRKIEVVVHTREGWLYAWESLGDACPGGRPNSDWRRFHHDERNTGYYFADTVPPGRVVDLTATHDEKGDILLRFAAPGDDWMCGTAEGYEIRYSADESADLSDWDAFHQADLFDVNILPREGGSHVSLRLQDIDAKVVALLSVDDAGNLSRASNAATVEPYTPDDDDDNDAADDDDVTDDDDDLSSKASTEEEDEGCGC